MKRTKKGLTAILIVTMIMFVVGCFSTVDLKKVADNERGPWGAIKLDGKRVADNERGPWGSKRGC